MTTTFGLLKDYIVVKGFTNSLAVDIVLEWKKTQLADAETLLSYSFSNYDVILSHEEKDPTIEYVVNLTV